VRAETHGGIMIHLRGLEATHPARATGVFEASFGLLVNNIVKPQKISAEKFLLYLHSHTNVH
ncbi:uncharacterized protein METZ01_LOCUS347577, partial [marine metagenome]